MMTVGGRGSDHFKSFTLPCFSMIATGDCSYENFCKFIHDRRLKCMCRIMHPSMYDRKEMNRRQKNQNATEKGFVVFYWPPMNVDGPYGHHTDRKYHLPVNPAPGGHRDYSYSCMVSMWEHFINVLTAPYDQNIEVMAFGHVNPYTNRTRLPVFRELSLCEVKRSVSCGANPSPLPHTPSTRSAAVSPQPMPAQLIFRPQVQSAVNMDSTVEELCKIADGDDDRDDRSVVTTSSDRSLESPTPASTATSAFSTPLKPLGGVGPEKRAPGRSPQTDRKTVPIART